eukprot:4407610-Alexandrium_andersonii.AAC.1
MWSAERAGARQSPCPRKRGGEPLQPATGNGRCTAGGRSDTGSAGPAPPNPRWKGSPFSGRAP